MNVALPLVTFDDRVLNKPLTLSEISQITRDAPKPLINPTAFLNWWTTALMHSAMSGRDVRYILTTLMPNISIDKLIEACETLSFDNDGPLEHETRLEKKYPWLDKRYKEEHIREMADFLQKMLLKRDITQILNCKRKSNEPMFEYAARFQKCWKEQAKLEIKEDKDPFFTAMFLNGLDPNSSYTLKIAAPDVYSLTPQELLKKIRELDAIGLFEKNKNMTQALQLNHEEPTYNLAGFQNTNRGREMRRGRGRGNGAWGEGQSWAPTQRGGYRQMTRRGRNFNQDGIGRGARRNPSDVCHYCQQMGHWARDCELKWQEECQRQTYTGTNFNNNTRPYTQPRTQTPNQQSETAAAGNVIWNA